MYSLFNTDIVVFPKTFLDTARYIASVQLESGAIPWFKDHLLDPWDHVEAAMGLSIAGFHGRAKSAYEWMARAQNPDGSLYPAYAGNDPLDISRKESHHAPYLATGLWHHYLITQDLDLVEKLWPHVEAAVEFALGMQTRHGEIAWALNAENTPCPDALVTGCASIYKSLECALNLADSLNKTRPSWKTAREKLGEVLKYRPERFDRTWESKERFSMDWFYPVLCGVVTGREARKRLSERWETFIHPGRGCRCVSDEPWITVAESCELVLALKGAGLKAQARHIFNGLHTSRDEQGAYWTGYQTELDIFWPEEKPTWTAGVVLMAADALYKITPAANLFTQVSLPREKEENDKEPRRQNA